jgi:hypothetical protein
MEKRILVIDIPATATAEETEHLLNEPYERGFYLFRMVSLWSDPGKTIHEGSIGGAIQYHVFAGERAFFRVRAHPEKE